MPRQFIPGRQPTGRKTKAVAGLWMSGFTAQSGSPSAVAAIATSGSKLRSFCVPATNCPCVCSDTATYTRPPGSPVAVPTSSRTGGLGVPLGRGVEVGGRVAVRGRVAVGDAVGAGVFVFVGVPVGLGVNGGSVHPPP